MVTVAKGSEDGVGADVTNGHGCIGCPLMGTGKE